ncbi:MAG TPA: phosphotransferase [Cellulomonas sp.]
MSDDAGGHRTRPSAAEQTLALDIARQIGRSAAAVDHLGGEDNRVFRVHGDGGPDHVIRFPADAVPDVLDVPGGTEASAGTAGGSEDHFATELWAMRRATTAGIPTTSVVDRGVCRGVPYLVLDHIAPAAPTTATATAAADRERAWHWLGRYARDLAAVRVDHPPPALLTRFGPDLPAAWRRHLAYNRDALDDADPLLADGAYRPADRTVLRDVVDRLARGAFTFGLAHHDLAPRNLVLRPGSAPPVLIDWGAVTLGPTPWTDVGRVYRWTVCDRIVDRRDYDTFARAARVDRPEDEVLLARLTALHLLDVTRWARDQSPDLYPQYLRDCASGLGAVLPRLGP